MNRDELAKMTKVEIVVGGSDVPAVRELLTSVGATGFTMLSGVSGLGHDGFHQGRLLFNDQDALTMLIVVAPDDRADSLLGAVRDLLRERPGVMFVSETWVSRPEHFR